MALGVDNSGPETHDALRALGFVILLAISVGRGVAAEHPVPLDPKADPSTCLACHQDKTRGKSVHPAMAMGCMSCHEIRVNRDITRVKLLTTVPYKLCLTCHSDKDTAILKGRVHPPALHGCLKCHDPHASDNRNQLLKPTSGDAKENLCLSCHKTGVDVPQSGSRHAALDTGCDTCHTIHKTGEIGKAEFDFHLTKVAPALCLDCHDAKSADLEKKHQNQPFERADCLTCHDPHESPAPDLMAKFMHPPFAGRQCEVCHAPAKEGKVVLTQTDAKSLCVSCHSDKAAFIAKAKVQHPGAAGDCTDCHNPHASSQPGLPKTNAVDICTGCHSDIAELGKKHFRHQPVFAQGCAICHAPHGGDNDHLLRVSAPNTLCLECHGPNSRPQKLDNEHLIIIFDGKVKLPANYFSKVPILPLEYGLGHPVERHPVSDLVDPGDRTKVLIPLNCLTCHQPHASAQPDLLVKDQANNAEFCQSCHKGLIGPQQGVSSTKGGR